MVLVKVRALPRRRMATARARPRARSRRRGPSRTLSLAPLAPPPHPLVCVSRVCVRLPADEGDCLLLCGQGREARGGHRPRLL